MIAYLVLREGAKWSDVYRLTPGQVVTIGRAPTNQIVIKDERASRYHSEIFLSEHRWTIRDLDSRNGTLVGSTVIRGDCALAPGDIVRIGQSQLAFVHDLHTAFPDSSTITKQAPLRQLDDETQFEADHALLADQQSAMITHRRGRTKFLADAPEEEQVATPKVGRAATKLCRLAFELAKAHDVVSMSNLALDGLFEETGVDAGAVHLLPRSFGGHPSRADLKLVASRSDSIHSYHEPSEFLASTVLRDGEAVLARNIIDDSTIGTRDSKGDMLATSILAAPIRDGQRTIGLVHLYSTKPERELDPDDLEFTLAVADTVAVALENLSRRQELAENLDHFRQENLQLRKRLGVESEIVGSSGSMAAVASQIAHAAPSRATVLIRGESGVGKELVARAVHFSSPRRSGPFICLNCAALAESLLESELFGHERGAFTGATERKIGKFEAAHDGTLLLDEIGEMSNTVQAKFLRVLEGHPFERVGGSESVRVDVRVIAATNRDLEQELAQGRFRRDLFFRLRVLEIVVPPLRDRPEDIVELARYFLERFSKETGRRIRGFVPRALEQMVRYPWPGNVRELKNVVERAVVLCRGPYIDEDELLLTRIAAEDAAAPIHNGAPPRLMSLDDVEREHILATLEATGWNKSRAAHLLGIERSTLDRKIHRYELKQNAR